MLLLRYNCDFSEEKKLPRKAVSSTFDRLIMSIALLLVFIIATRTPVDADMWWHLRSGEEMVTQGRILLEDIFSYTRHGSPWVNAFWLSDILTYLIFKLGGYFSLGAFVALMTVATFGIAIKQMRGPAFLRALLLILAVMTAAPILTPRPQLFSFLLLALLDLWLSSLKKGSPIFPIWWLIPLFALWANLHGGYIWGILLLIAILAGEVLNHWFSDQKEKVTFLRAKTLKKLLFFSILALFAVLLNPNGFALWRLPFYTVDVSLAAIQEWHSPDFHQISFHPMLWMLFLFILGLGNSGKKIDYSDLLKVIGFAYLTFFSQRNIAPYAIIILPVMSRQLALAWENWIVSPVGMRAQHFLTSSPRQELPLTITRLINRLLVSLIVVAALGNLYILTRPAKVDESYPRPAIRWIEENQPQGALFNSYNWGGYLVWTLRDYPVFIDGRADLYGDEIIGQWWQVAGGGETAQQILDEWDVRIILLEPSWPLVRELSQYGWELMYEDEMSVVYGR